MAGGGKVGAGRGKSSKGLDVAQTFFDPQVMGGDRDAPVAEQPRVIMLTFYVIENQSAVERDRLLARGILDAIVGDIRRLECPRRAIAHLPPFDDAEAGHAQSRHHAHIHDLRGSFKRNLAPLSPFARRWTAMP
ncbi:hypothetical protein NKI00_32755 [Mesorhizobium sp. M0847]